MPRISLRLVVGFSQVVILIMNGAHHSNWASVILEGIAVPSMPLDLFGVKTQKWLTFLIVKGYGRCYLSCSSSCSLAISNAFKECLVIVETVRQVVLATSCHALPISGGCPTGFYVVALQEARWWDAQPDVTDCCPMGRSNTRISRDQTPETWRFWDVGFL